MVYSSTVNTTYVTLDLKDYAKGLYIIQINGETGNVANGKVIIE